MSCAKLGFSSLLFSWKSELPPLIILDYESEVIATVAKDELPLRLAGEAAQVELLRDVRLLLRAWQ